MKKLILVIIILMYFLVNSTAQDCALEDRPSITFIIGEEQSEDFFTLAKQYYLTRSEVRTDMFVDSCQSLLSVRNHLEASADHGGLAWGHINLVLHSNQWTGISVPLLPDGQRTTVESLFSAIQNGEFTPLSDSIVDEYTQFNLVSCGLGKNKDMLYALRLGFGGFDDQQPIVTASEDFVHFSYDERQQVKLSYLKPFYAFYKTAYKPADLHLRSQLESRYPNVAIDWLTAMQTKIANEAQTTFHTKFNVPIVWNVNLDVPKERVELEEEFDKIEFIRAQEDLMKTLDKFDIPIEKFRWQMKVSEKDGKAQVQIKGKATVLCVLAEV